MTNGVKPQESEADGGQPVTRRRRIVLALLALIGIGPLSSGAIDPAAIAAVLRDPLSIFAERSPGERAPGALTQTKPLRSAIRRVPVPEERVLSNVRQRAPGPLEPALASAPGAIVAPDAPIDDVAGVIGDTDPVDGGGGGGGNFFVPPGANAPGVGLPITGGGGGGEGGGDDGGGGGVTPPTPAVPEPATWLTMIVGVFVIGWSLRRRRGAPAPSQDDVRGLADDRG